MYDDLEQNKQQDPWSSIVDLMSALVLVLFLAVIFFITNYSEVTQRLDQEHQNLMKQTAKLEQSESRYKDLNQAYHSLEQKEQDLRQQAQTLKQQAQTLRQQAKTLTDQRDQLQSDMKLLENTRRQLEADKQKLENDKISLNTDVENLKNSVTSLKKEQNDLIQNTDRLNKDKKRLQTEKSDLNNKHVSLIDKQKKLESEKQKLLADQKALIGNQEKLQSDKERLNAIIVDLKSKIKDLAQNQNRIMTSLDQAFKKANAEGVEVDKEGGKIIMKSEVLFTLSQADLSESGKVSLSKVASALDKVLQDSRLKKQVDGIMIEGHTSSEGPVNRNFDLSSERSLNALKYLLSLPTVTQNKKLYQSLLFAAAFGESRPVLRPNGTEDKIQSRRIEIRMIFNRNNVKKLTYELSKFK